MHSVPVQATNTTEETMRIHIFKYGRYICLSMLAGFLVTGVPGEGRALGSENISEGAAHDSAGVPDAYVLLPLCSMREGLGPCSPPGVTIPCQRSSDGATCHVTCLGKGSSTKWSRAQCDSPPPPAPVF